MAYTIKPNNSGEHRSEKPVRRSGVGVNRRILHPLKAGGFTKAERTRVEDWLTYEEDFLRRPHPRTAEERERVNRIGRKLDSLCRTIVKEVL